MAACHYHYDRPGVGVCMRCRVVVCKDCATRVDGINHCHVCLKKLGSREQAPRSSGLSWSVLALGTVGVCSLFLFGVGWLLQGWLAPVP